MKKLLLFLGLATPALAQTPPDTAVFAPRRAVMLQGTSNFRDLGGYPAAGGKHVKWGHIYRSADISKLTDSDLLALQKRHVALVCDLRGPQEVAQAPDRLPAGARHLALPAGSEKIDPRLLMGGSKNLDRDSLMRAVYTNTSFFKAKYKPLFDELLTLDNGQALLFHCTAGKDRTGIGAALVLAALGVDRATILRDYAATDVYWQAGRAQSLQRMSQAGMSAEAVNTVRPLLAANPAYLAGTFAALDRQYGSMDKFLATQMDLTPAKRAALRAKYLQ
ncbi:tyrosine-protein phosphatase [Hymenobacter ginsengisoli]|uniref:Tyrosine-protein phosphatase n=1 Tax=Hymenobacter ginsengisoli TaxID=1051626 RepID=A0ABP8QGW6_9BACT|nr:MULTISPECIES: tyrosine-protein phosphatase [unclassified Hymenobacter]MBO2029979.1 tyrosine-protein phosphatase [Hymenobacter sp. BT559]